MSTLAIWCRLVRSRDFSAPRLIADIGIDVHDAMTVSFGLFVFTKAFLL